MKNLTNWYICEGYIKLLLLGRYLWELVNELCKSREETVQFEIDPNSQNFWLITNEYTSVWGQVSQIKLKNFSDTFQPM